MTLFNAAPNSRAVDPYRVNGRHTLYDDGWRTRLDLVWDGTRLDASLYSYDRTRGSFPVSVDLDLEDGTFVLVVENFNEVASQRYEGLVWTTPDVGIAGTTIWNDQLFGFFAAPRPPLPLGKETATLPSLADLCGTYVLHTYGGTMLVHIPTGPDAPRRGSIRVSDGTVYGCGVEADGEDPRRFVLTPEGLEAFVTVWMFSRNHDSLAGWVERDGRRAGCYLIRIATDENTNKEAR